MGDSDDEYDRRRARDKFRRERSDYQERRDERNRREDFPESSRDRSGRRDYRDYDPRSRRERYSPPRHDLSPPIKRMRRDWDDRGGYGSYGGYDLGYPPSGGGGGGMMGGPHGPWGGGGMAQDMNMMHGGHGEPEGGLTQPPMKSFKAFLGMQDDTIDDQEAVKKYNEYKQEFRRNQISEFFINHKEEEWFKSKYHPEECSKRRTEQREALQKRLNIFMEFLNAGWMDQVAIDVEKSDQIVRLLDAVVIKLEGGTDNDLRALDEPIEEEKPKETPTISSLTTSSSVPNSSSTATANASPEKDKKTTKSENSNSNSPTKKQSDDSDNDDSDSSTGSSSDSDDDDDEKDEKGRKSEGRSKKQTKIKEEKEDEEEKYIVKEEAPDDDVVEPPFEKTEEKDDEVEEEGEVKAPPTVKKEPEDDFEKKAEPDAGAEEDIQVEEENQGLPRPRPLHRTCSIFLRNLAPTITKQEVESICKRYNGFLRVAIADPQPERRFFRRGWVTFERTENIKDTCWSLNNIRLRDCELGAIVNRDLSRRIRSVNGITAHKQVARSDIKLAARIIQNMDSHRELWVSEEQKQLDVLTFGLGSKNPLLKNITDYLIEEASAEEEELLGVSASLDPENKDGEDAATHTIDKDDTLLKVVDRLLLYLRVVHSVDYYNHSEYPNEDEMPNRCGIMHARGSAPNSKVTPQELNDYIQTFEHKVSPFLQTQVKLSDEDANKLGRKDPESEVEKFIQANSQELAKDKWLCPLSGKKFKGPEFIRKHIFNKHGEKVDEVKKEVEYFNNYLQDPKRPQLPEHPQNRQQQSGGGPRGDMMMPYPGGGGGAFPPGGPPFPGGPGGFRGPPPGFIPGGFGGRNSFPDMYNRPGTFSKRSSYGRNPRTETRKIITYRDLDAPSENDFF